MRVLSSQAPTLLLVHGAWHGPWCWDKVAPLLSADGVRSHAVELPFSGFDDDVARVRAALQNAVGPVITCAHSYGGRVTSAACDGSKKVAHLVYIAAALPNPAQLERYEREIALRPPPAEWLDASAVREAFYGDCSDQDATEAMLRLRPMKQVGDLSGLRSRPWERVPSTYIVCGRDNVLDPDFQREMAGNAGEVIEFDTGHSPFLSAPDELARCLSAIVERYNYVT